MADTERIPCLETRIVELEEEIAKLKSRETTFSKPETPGQFLDKHLIGTTIGYEDILGVFQILIIHSRTKDWDRICRYASHAEISRLKSAHSDMAELYRKAELLRVEWTTAALATKDAFDTEGLRLRKRNSELIDVVTYLKGLLSRAEDLFMYARNTTEVEKIVKEIAAIKQAQEEADNAEDEKM